MERDCGLPDFGYLCALLLRSHIELRSEADLAAGAVKGIDVLRADDVTLVLFGQALADWSRQRRQNRRREPDRSRPGAEAFPMRLSPGAPRREWAPSRRDGPALSDRES